MALDDAYRALARRLDETPNGFPATASGAELRLLAWLFTPEEAALAAQMRLTPEPAGELAARTGGELREVRTLLKSMARKGLIHVVRQQHSLGFALLPFAIGLYEMQGERMDEELASLVEAYIQEAFPGVLAVQPPLTRVIPVEEAVPAGIEIMPYESASQILDQAAAWGVTDCLCRRQQRLLGKGCDAPLDVCLALSTVPGAFDNTPGVRALTREEAGETLRRAEEAGLVHATSNTHGGLPYLWFICNCCSCCCGILRGVAEFGIEHSVAHSAFWATVDEAACTGCEACLERCRFSALSVVDGLAQVDRERCAGCGLCAAVCPADALSLIRRPELDTPPVPEDNDAWWAERARNRGLDLGRIL